MNSKEAKNLDILRELWAKGITIARELDSSDNDTRYDATKAACRWQRHLQVVFRSMFYNPKFYNELMEVFPETEEVGVNYSASVINSILGHLEGIGQMLRYGYIKDQFAGINNDHSAICFVAMPFAPEYMDLFINGIKPAIEFLGYQAIRVDEYPHNDRTDAKILELINQAKFVVADFSGQRTGVYYEAGYAKGLGLQVIHTCLNSEKNNLHFDIETVNTILYSTTANLRKQLQSRIEQTIGAYIGEQQQNPPIEDNDIPF